jgi:YD repeat-containing protein
MPCHRWATYDPEGDRVTTTPSGKTAITSTYDQAWRLIAYTNPNTSTTATYIYDGDGRRASKTVNGTTEPFTWDLTQPAPALIQDGTLPNPPRSPSKNKLRPAPANARRASSLILMRRTITVWNSSASWFLRQQPRAANSSS